MSETTEQLVDMARAAKVDDRLSDGALYGKLADEIERLNKLVTGVMVHVLPPWSGFETSPEMRVKIYDDLVRVMYGSARPHGEG